MRIIVIGACGFIGKEFTSYAIDEGHQIIGYDVIDKSGFLDCDKYLYHDLRNGLHENDFKKADAIVMLAAKRPSNEFNYEDYQNNVAIAQQYVVLAKKYRKTLVFASSKAVYSGDRLPYKEDEYSIPFSLYGASKLAVEQIGLFQAKEFGFSFISLRFAQVIGRGERKGFLINTLIDNAKEGRCQIVYGTGEQKRHYIYVKDVCRALLIAASQKELSGVFNIGMKEAISNLEFAECVNEVYGNTGNLRHDYQKMMVMTNDFLDINKAKNILKFESKYDLKEALCDLKNTD